MSRSCGVVLVGGAGFIGRHLAGLDGAEIVQGDLTDEVALRGALRPGDTVVHLAWSTLPASSNERPDADAADNILGSLRLFATCAASGVRRILFFSSGGTVYGNAARVPIRETDATDPICAYGISKLAVEKYLALERRLRGLDYLIVRPANVYGPGQDPARGQSAATVFAHRAVCGEPITIWGDGSAVRDYLYIDDLTDAVARLLAFTPETDGARIFNVGTGVGVSLRSLLEKIRGVLGREPVVRYTAGRALDVSANVLDAGRLALATAWKPRVSLTEGLRRMIRAWEAQGTVSAGSGKPACG
jgi:UDP-glucose 4-epimerase